MGLRSLERADCAERAAHTERSPSTAIAAPAGPSLVAADGPDKILSEEGATKLEDGTIIDGPNAKVARGDTELWNDRWAIYRDPENRLRVRAVTPREHPMRRTPAPLSLGDRAVSGDWEVRWIAVRDGLVTFKGTHRKSASEEWKALVERRPTHELASKDGLFHFEVSLVAVNGDLERGGSIAITGDAVERATTATFGQSLAPGIYVFPDGLRIRVQQTAGCDFDTSVPCFGGTYRADAALGAQQARVEWRTRTTRVLGHTIELASSRVIVRK